MSSVPTTEKACGDMVGLLVTKSTNIHCEIWYDKSCNTGS
jgi:hypothetical protein